VVRGNVPFPLTHVDPTPARDRIPAHQRNLTVREVEYGDTGSGETDGRGRPDAGCDMNRPRLIGSLAYDVGRMLGLVSLAMATLLAIGVLFGEFHALVGVAGALAITGGASGLLLAVGKPNPRPSRAYGMLVAALGWLTVALVGALPFLGVAWAYQLAPPAGVPLAATAPFGDPMNAFFESMSGFTGTGLSVAPAPAQLPHVLQWWRSLTEWVGGIGVIVLTTAILSRPGSGSLTLYESDARAERLHFEVLPRLRSIVGIVVLFTAGSVVLLLSVGLPPWAALNDAMTGLTTGGFSVTNASIGAYHDPLVSLAFVPIMATGSIAFPVLYLVLRGEVGALRRDVQARWFAGICLVGTAVLVGTFSAARSGIAGHHVVIAALFQFVSALSCTGFSTVPIGSLPTNAKLLLVLAMVVGGSAGSTVGGIKLIRLLTLSYGTVHRIRGTFYPPHVVRPLRVGERLLTEAQAALEIEEAAIISFLWVVFLLGGVAVLQAAFAADGTPHTLWNVVFEVASAQGNVGLSTGITTAGLPAAVKLSLAGNMWIGRLEIIPVAVALEGLLTGLNASR